MDIASCGVDVGEAEKESDQSWSRWERAAQPRCNCGDVCHVLESFPHIRSRQLSSAIVNNLELWTICLTVMTFLG